MSLPRLSLQVLDAFEQVARLGSMKRAAEAMGLSISSVSHHVARLEEALGVTLIDRSARPFALTPEGREAFRHLSAGLQHLRRATSETVVGGLLGARSLRVGIVEDFESGVAPELAVTLARRMPRAALSIRTILSHEAVGLLARGALDIAVAAEAADLPPDLPVAPLVRDPFVLAMPREVETTPEDLLRGRPALPFLRFNRDHLIGRQIEAQLTRNRIAPPDRYAFDSAHSIMAVIAGGAGWSILTPLGCLRASRYAAQVRLHRLPLAAFSRRISLLARPDFDPPVAEAIAMLLRQAIGRLVVAPVLADHPWLAPDFTILGPDGNPG
ncbi:LysR family transcriptional regulator [Thetidibacter halocola]|uniref:LysR family transcriptional regulator n=1 Tax=Thetidibacter halocola TaxID=2827239 RepID=A0A8J8B6K6_9RHOB|nr:LysR family transcriptional regulator [Thetidibacter halocola]MBS0124111.1 LysR family transcriptional regulator [Thetidibacter halocola]